jgi:hypothetical protein
MNLLKEKSCEWKNFQGDGLVKSRFESGVKATVYLFSFMAVMELVKLHPLLN